MNVAVSILFQESFSFFITKNKNVHRPIKMCTDHVHGLLAVCIIAVQIIAQCVHCLAYVLTHILLYDILRSTGKTVESCYELG